MKRRYLALLTALLLALGLSACGGSSRDAASGNVMTAPATMNAAADRAEYGYWAEEAYELPAEAEKLMASGGGTTDSERPNLPDGVKMIYTARLELETTTFETACGDVETLARQLGGYLEQQSSNNYSSSYRSASYTVRVPAEQFDTFLRQIGTLCRVRYQSQNAEDVSERYYDVESRLETAKIKLDRLQELLTKADSMEDIITLEGAISDVEYQIESLSGEKRHYDALIGYSTIYVTLNEVYKVSEQENAPLTFGQRIGGAFREGLRDFGEFLESAVEWFAYSWLRILAAGAVAVVLVKLIRRFRNSGKLLRKKGKDAPMKPTEENPQNPKE